MADEPPEVRETHAGLVFLIGDRAYKLKKPVDLEFLDFSTRELRLRACRREVELNRRLAPDVYLGIADISDGHGQLCDHLVVMRRMPRQRRLTTLIAAHQPLANEVRALARQLATFHAGADRSAAITEQGGRDALTARWEASFDHITRAANGVLPVPLFQEIVRRTRAFLAGRADLFSDRQTHGRVVDGHGDLIAEDVFCLDDGPRVLDCLEFDDRLRWLDGLDDAAFLAMDLEHHGRPDLARTFLDAYAEFGGDPAPSALRHHYVAYRAFVRAKVACLRHVQGGTDARAEARSYAELAATHLRAGTVRLILVGGLPGTGKSTLAGRLADDLGAVLLSSDRVRKELAGLAPTTSAHAPYGSGIYTTAHSRRCYAEILHRAQALLRRGESVVLDASWIHAEDRTAAEAIVADTHSELVALRCSLSVAAADARITGRAAADPSNASDADPLIAAAMADAAEPWPHAVELDTSGSPEHTLAAALAALSHPLVVGDQRSPEE